MLTKEELNAVNNNVMVIMQSRIMAFTGCDKRTANLVANEVLNLDAEAERIFNEEADIKE